MKLCLLLSLLLCCCKPNLPTPIGACRVGELKIVTFTDGGKHVYECVQINNWKPEVKK